MSRPRRGAPWLVRALGAVAAVGLAAVLLAIWRGPGLGLFVRRQTLQALIARLGPLGPLALISLQAAQVIVAPIPGQALGLAGGYLYGALLGTLYSMVGLTLGTALAAWLARRWGRPLVERLVDAEILARIDRFAERLGPLMLFVVFIVPFLPDDAIVLIAGLADVPLPGILAASVLGRLPGVVVLAWVGATAARFSPVYWAAAVALALAIAIPLYRWRGELERGMWALIERIAAPRREGSPAASEDEDEA
jgi:uncharacterized membrane protein YdjX (TVP38/TMEM64 family)